MNDIIINKIQSIQRYVQRAREIYASDPDGFDTDCIRQDAAIFNVLRACEQAIDLANHVIRKHKMGIPGSSTESFDLLRQKSVIDAPLAEKLKKMIYFRNTVTHGYQRTDMNIVRAIIISDLDDLIHFGDSIMEFSNNPV